MGYFNHQVCVTVVYDEISNSKFEALRERMREHGGEDSGDFWAGLILGPSTGSNGHYTWVFACDGSKEGWETSNQANVFREEFRTLANSCKWSEVAALSWPEDGDPRAEFD